MLWKKDWVRTTRIHTCVGKIQFLVIKMTFQVVYNQKREKRSCALLTWPLGNSYGQNANNEEMNNSFFTIE